MKYANILFICFIAVFWSCTSPEEQSGLKQITIDAGVDTETNLSELAKDVNVIKLEVTDNSLVSRVSELAYNGEFIVISDSRKVYVFSAEGKFLRVIGKNGQGPGEYNYVPSFAVDWKKNELYLAANNRVIVYNINGQLINEVKIPFVRNIYHGSSGLQFIAHELGKKIPGSTRLRNATYLVSMTDKLEIADSVLLRSTSVEGLKAMAMPNGLTFYSSDDKSNFVYYPVPLFYEDPVMRDTLYKQAGDEIKADVKLDFGIKDRLAQSFDLLSISKSKNYYLAKYRYGTSMHQALHSISSGKTFVSKEGFNDDVHHSGPIILMPLNGAEDLYYFVKEGPEMVDIMEGATDEDNPYLFLVKLKD